MEVLELQVRVGQAQQDAEWQAQQSQGVLKEAHERVLGALQGQHAEGEAEEDIPRQPTQHAQRMPEMEGELLQARATESYKAKPRPNAETERRALPQVMAEKDVGQEAGGVGKAQCRCVRSV